MSRGFVKEEDQEEAPFIPPRAALPAGITNYVTPEGYENLLKEKEELEHGLSNINIEDEKEKRHARAVLTGKLNLLNERISSSRILNPVDQPSGEIRFGAKVNFEIVEGEQKGVIKTFQLVGVDEANIKLNKIAFVAPIAMALTGNKVGDIVEFRRGSNIQKFEILSIAY